MTRKPYQRPKLAVHGDIREITKAGPAMGMTNDNLTGMNKSG